MATTDKKRISDDGTSAVQRGLLEVTPADLVLLSENAPLGAAISTPLTEVFFDRIMAANPDDSAGFDQRDISRSKSEYKAYFVGVFEGKDYVPEPEAAKFVFALDTNFYLTTLPYLIDLFAELALDHPLRSDCLMPDLVKAVSGKLWSDALAASNNVSFNQNKHISDAVAESKKWQSQNDFESEVMASISEVIQSSTVIDQNSISPRRWIKLQKRSVS